MREQDDVQDASVEFEPIPLLVDELCVASRTARRMGSPLFRFGKSVRRVTKEFVRATRTAVASARSTRDAREEKRARSCRLSS